MNKVLPDLHGGFLIISAATRSRMGTPSAEAFCRGSLGDVRGLLRASAPLAGKPSLDADANDLGLTCMQLHKRVSFSGTSIGGSWHGKPE